MTTVQPSTTASTATPSPRDQRAARDHTERDEHRLTALAAALYVANATYAEALKMADPAATLDDICDAWPEIAPEVLGVAKTAPENAEAMKAAITDRMWAYAVVEHARTEVGNDYGYVLDVLASALKRGAGPQAIRDEVPRVVKRLRIENTISAAVNAITTAMATALAGLTTNPRDAAERLHTAIDDAQAEHLARIGDMSLEKAEAAEAFSTATYAMEQAVKLSPDPKGTAEGLCTALRMVIAEAGERP